MVDFRYHLVSLISVFLALAVGIVLGAGPLGGTISEQLDEQVEQLRVDKETLRDELAAEQDEHAQDEAFIEASAGQLLRDALPQYRVAIVRLPGVSDDVVTALTQRLEQSGAIVSGEVSLTDMWADPQQAAFRAQVAGAMSTALGTGEVGDEDADQVGVLARGLMLALTQTAPEDPTTSSPEAIAAHGVLTGGQEPLVEVGEIAPSDIVLLATPPTQEPEAGATTDPDAVALREGWVTALTKIAVDSPAVVAGYAVTSIDLLPAVRGVGGVTTVDGLGTTVGRITVPLALGAALSGLDPIAYGFGEGATAVLPDVVTLEPAPWSLPEDAATPAPGDAETPSPAATATEEAA